MEETTKLKIAIIILLIVVLILIIFMDSNIKDYNEIVCKNCLNEYFNRTYAPLIK